MTTKKTSFYIQLLVVVCLLLAANAAFGATLPACSTMSGSSELCVVTTGTLTVTSGPDPLKLGGSVFTAVTGVPNTAVSAWTSGWSVLNAPVNPGSSHTYSGVPLTLTSVSTVLVLTCNGGATVALNATSSQDSLSVTTCNLAVGGLPLAGSTFTTSINFPGNTIVQALPLPFSSAAIGAGSTGTYVCGLGAPLCPTTDPTTLSISNGTITSTCVGCTTMGLIPPVTTGFKFTMQQGGATPPSQTLTVEDSAPAAVVSYATSVSITSPAGGTWLSVSPAGGQIGGSPTASQVSVTPGALAPGTYTGSIKVYGPARNSPLTEPVTFTITSTPFTLMPSPTSFTFNSVNSASPPTQNLSVASSTGTQVAFTATAASTGSWLSVSPTSGTTGVTTIVVKADPTKVSAGVNSGTITLAASGTANVIVNVTFNETTVPTPSALTFNGTQGGSNPASQMLSVTSTAGPTVTYTASATSTGNWLSVSPGSGTTNGSPLTVSANIAGLLATGSPFSGTINITPAGGAVIPVGVTLTLTSLPSMVPGTPSLTFTSIAGAVPANQMLGVTSSTSTAISYSVAASSSGWLQVSPSSGTTPGTETVSINSTKLGTLGNGTYNGSVIFTCTPTTSCGNASGQLSVPVTLVVAASSYTISGQVTLLGSGPDGVTITLTGTQSGTTTSDSSGDYSFTVAGGGNYTVSASKSDYYFYPYPSSFTFNNITADQTANFQGAVRSDFNGDGHPDVIWEAPTTGFAQIWYLGGLQGVTLNGAANLTQTNPWKIVAIADFDGNGIPDVVWQDPVSGAVQVWFMGGSGGNTLISAANITNKNSWKVVSVADFNQDGRPDLLWQDPTSGFSQVWYMGGSKGTTIQGAANLDETNPWHIVGTGDFNNDGFPDVLWQDPKTGTVQIWYMGGTTPGQQGTQLQSAVNLTANSWNVVAIADFNQDGHPDVVFESPTNGAAQVFYYTGTKGTTPSGSAVLSAPNPWFIAGPH